MAGIMNFPKGEYARKGCIPYSNTIKVTYTSGESTAKTINIGFKQKFVIVKDGSGEYYRIDFSFTEEG